MDFHNISIHPSLAIKFNLVDHLYNESFILGYFFWNTTRAKRIDSFNCRRNRNPFILRFVGFHVEKNSLPIVLREEFFDR